MTTMIHGNQNAHGGYINVGAETPPPPGYQAHSGDTTDATPAPVTIPMKVDASQDTVQQTNTPDAPSVPMTTPQGTVMIAQDMPGLFKDFKNGKLNFQSSQWRKGLVDDLKNSKVSQAVKGVVLTNVAGKAKKLVNSVRSATRIKNRLIPQNGEGSEPDPWNEGDERNSPTNLDAISKQFAASGNFFEKNVSVDESANVTHLVPS